MKRHRKLALNKTTVRHLGALDLAAAQGGEPIPSGVADDGCFPYTLGNSQCPLCFSHRPGIC